MTLRVLHVIPSISPRRGGPSEAVIEMVRALRQRDIDAEIATTDEDAAPAGKGEPVEHRGLPVRFFGRRGKQFCVVREFAYSPSFSSWLARHIGRYDLLHVHALFSYLPTQAMRVARQERVPYINRPLGLLGRWPLQQSAWRKRAYLSLVEKANLLSARALHFVSNLEETEAAELGLPVRGAVVPHGITMPRIIPDARRKLLRKSGICANRKIVLFLGRIHAKKGLDLLIGALAALRPPRPALLIAGDGPERQALECLAGQAGVSADCRWLGFVEGELKNLCLQGADLFALTSRHENFGMAVLEALAAGAPVLISPQVGLAPLIERARVGTVAPLNVAAIAKAMTEALKGDCPSLRSACRAFVQKEFTWDANAAALEKLYGEAVKSSR